MAVHEIFCNVQKLDFLTYYAMVSATSARIIYRAVASDRGNSTKMVQRQSSPASKTDNAHENVATSPIEVTRVFVSGLPPKFTSEQLATHFRSGFQVTDAHVIADRRIGFVGFQDSKSAKKAVQQYNKSYVRMSKISVDLAKPVELTRTSGASVPVSKRGQTVNELDPNRKRKRSDGDDGEDSRISTPQDVPSTENLNGLVEEEQSNTQLHVSTTDHDWLRSRTKRTLDLDNPDELLVEETTASKDIATKAPDESTDLSVTREQTQTTKMIVPVPREVSNGRLFLRNLAFAVTQNDLEALFSKFGKIQEVSLISPLLLHPCNVMISDRDNLCFCI